MRRLKHMLANRDSSPRYSSAPRRSKIPFRNGMMVALVSSFIRLPVSCLFCTGWYPPGLVAAFRRPFLPTETPTAVGALNRAHVAGTVCGRSGGLFQLNLTAHDFFKFLEEHLREFLCRAGDQATTQLGNLTTCLRLGNIAKNRARLQSVRHRHHPLQILRCHHHLRRQG